jgi:hypothetical protein
MKTEQILVSSIIPAKYNPKQRTDNIGQLMKSIKDHGIIMPLIIDSNNNLIDGHRRLASAKALKIAKVPVIQMDSKLTKDKAFEIINSTSKKISNHDLIFIHVNGGSIPKRALNKINQLEELVGKDGLKRLGERGATYTVLNYAWIVRKYCGESSDNFLKKTVFWLIDNKMIYAVRRAMEGKVKKDVISRAINLNRPLKIKYE